MVELAEQFARGEQDDDYEQTLDRVRRQVGELRFKLGVQLIEGSRDPIELGESLARVAEAALVLLARAAIAEFETVHGRIAGGELVILGLGRMGGGALTHASDLDLVFLFTGEHTSESDGARPLGATLYFNRLAQRVIAALSVPTAEGALYEVDTRLRPSGAQGPIAVSFAAFERYQREAAWTWEHMALARARPLFGPKAALAQLRTIIASVLSLPRDSARLKADVLAMRGEMAQHKPPKGPLDIKLARGGLVDVEFIVHFLQLRDGTALCPSIPAALAALIAARQVLPELASAHAALSRFLIASRLLAPDGQVPPPAARAVLASACQCRDWDELIALLDESRAVVGAVWTATFSEALEI